MNFTMNFTDIANQASQAAQSGYGSASAWASDASNQASSKAREWLATTTMSPQQKEECLHAASQAMTALFKCHSVLPNQFESQTQERCNCWFQMHRRIQAADCQDFESNITSGNAMATSSYGQISVESPDDLATRCQPYYDAWLAAHPDASLLQLFWDRVCLFFSENPGALWCLLILLLVLLALLFLKYARQTTWGRHFIADVNETRKQLYEACTAGEYEEFAEDPPEYGEKGAGDQVSSREVFAVQNDEASSMDSDSVADFGSRRSSKAQRKLKVYEEESEPEEDEEWQGIGYFFQSLFSPSQEQPDADELHYHMVQEGPSLAELRLQRQAEEQGISVVELQQRQRQMQQAEAAQPLASSSSLQAGAAVNSQYHQPPYYNVNRTSEDGHHTVHANPEVLQQAAMRSAPAQFLPAQPQNMAMPFPHERAYYGGTPPPQGRGQGGQQGFAV